MIMMEENGRQKGLFLPNDPGYLKKLEDNAELIVHQTNAGVLGFVFFYCNAQDKISSYITLIATDVNVRGMGIGRGLLEHVVSLSRIRGFSFCHLEVRKDNVRALDFYKGFGFVAIESREDSLLMRFSLK